MEHRISELQIIPIKAKDGLVGYASFVLDEILYLGSIGIITRPTGGFRLLYPNNKANTNIFHPINKEFANEIEKKVANKFLAVTNP